MLQIYMSKAVANVIVQLLNYSCLFQAVFRGTRWTNTFTPKGGQIQLQHSTYARAKDTVSSHLCSIPFLTGLAALIILYILTIIAPLFNIYIYITERGMILS